MNYKEKSALGWEIANWLYIHEEFQIELADNIFLGRDSPKSSFH